MLAQLTSTLTTTLVMPRRISGSVLFVMYFIWSIITLPLGKRYSYINKQKMLVAYSEDFLKILQENEARKQYI